MRYSMPLPRSAFIGEWCARRYGPLVALLGFRHSTRQALLSQRCILWRLCLATFASARLEASNGGDFLAPCMLPCRTSRRVVCLLDYAARCPLRPAAGFPAVDTEVRLWDVDLAAERAALPHADRVNVCLWIPERGELVTAGGYARDCSVRCWRVAAAPT